MPYHSGASSTNLTTSLLRRSSRTISSRICSPTRTCLRRWWNWRRRKRRQSAAKKTRNFCRMRFSTFLKINNRQALRQSSETRPLSLLNSHPSGPKKSHKKMSRDSGDSDARLREKRRLSLHKNRQECLLSKSRSKNNSRPLSKKSYSWQRKNKRNYSLEINKQCKWIRVNR